MSFTISNQKPGVLDPVHTLPIAGNFDPMPALTKGLIDPLFEPLATGSTLSIVDDKNHSYDRDEILAVLNRTFEDVIDPAAESMMKEIYQQSLIHYDQNSPLVVDESYVIQAAQRQRLPRPGPNTIYTAASDVIPAAKAMLAGQSGAEDLFFSSLSFIYSPQTLGYWFLTEDSFARFTEWLDHQVQSLSGVLPGQVVTLLNQFTKIKLSSLTESLVLRTSPDTENYEYSFARVLTNMLMTYTAQQVQGASQAIPQEMGVMPFSITELYQPLTLVIANVERHARSSPVKVNNEWKLIKASLNSPVKVISNQALSKLTAMPRAKAQAAARVANAQSNKQHQKLRSAQITFRQQPPKSVNVVQELLRVLRKMKEVNRSQNVFKRSKVSFLKANRRDPDDYNKPGRIISTHYLPDLHIYLDCSGSIDERNYQAAVIMMIKMAKKMNVNLYFNSFSHVMSQETLLRVKDRSVNSVWNEFRRLPKVNGGTDFEQIWKYINASKVRKGRLSLVITDFGWEPRRERETHPKNLYYAPVSNFDWSRITYYAKNYVKTMQHIEPAIAQRMLGVFK